MSYFDFDLEVGLQSGRRYPLSASSMTGESKGELKLPWDLDSLDRVLLELDNARLRQMGRLGTSRRGKE